MTFPVSWLATGSCQSPAWIISDKFRFAYSAGVHKKQQMTCPVSSSVQRAPQGQGAFADGEPQITFKQPFQDVCTTTVFSIPKDVDVGRRLRKASARALTRSAIYEESSTCRPLSPGDMEGTIIVIATCVETQTPFAASRYHFIRNSRMTYRMSNDLSRTT